MKTLLAPFRWLYVIYALLVFVAIMFVILPFFMILSWGGRFHGANRMIRLCMFWADCWMPLVFMRHKNYFEAPHDPNRPTVFVANHISYFDAIILVKTIRQHFRPLGRVETATIPIFGFIYRNAIVTVDRNDPKNRADSVSKLKELLQKGISIFVFPEGTFNMTSSPLKSFYDGAFKIAIETRTPIKPILFLDGYKLMHYRNPLSLSPGLSRSIYLEEISVEGYTLDDISDLKRRVMDVMEKKLIEYQAPWINR
jgi:1-acyl-sn-glycerol-3-phosphate acyltransferase